MELAVAVVLGTAFTNLISAVTSVSGQSREHLTTALAAIDCNIHSKCQQKACWHGLLGQTHIWLMCLRSCTALSSCWRQAGRRT